MGRKAYCANRFDLRCSRGCGLAGTHAVSSPRTRRAVSTTSLSFRSWYAWLMVFPITDSEKPHCGLHSCTVTAVLAQSVGRSKCGHHGSGALQQFFVRGPERRTKLPRKGGIHRICPAQQILCCNCHRTHIYGFSFGVGFDDRSLIILSHDSPEPDGLPPLRVL